MIGAMNGSNGQTWTEATPKNVRVDDLNEQRLLTPPERNWEGEIVDASLGLRLVTLDRVVGSPRPDRCRALLTVAGLDRTNLIAGISRLLLDLGLNIEGSFGVLLDEGQGLVLLVEGTDAKMRELEQRVREMDGNPLRGFRIERGRRFELCVVTRDEPGIVCRIAETLVKYNANLTSMMTRNTVGPADENGEGSEIQAVIVMTMEVPTGCARTRGQLLDEMRSLFPAPRKVSLDEIKE